MDAGLAALFGALTGSFGTIGAALVSGRMQRAGVEIVTRAEHRNSRREPREAVYKEYAASVIALIDWEYYDDEPSQDDELHPMLGEIRKKWTEVQFAGPQAVKNSSDRVMDACVAFRVAVRDRAYAGFETPITWIADARDSMAARLSLFMDAAQKALDDDGTRRRFRG